MNRHFASLIINYTKSTVLALLADLVIGGRLMRCIPRVAACSIVLLAFSAFSIPDAAAVPITLNLVSSSSHILQSGFSMSAQDGVSGTTDGNAARPSNDTNFQGTITVDVDSLVAPTSIRILSSAADADVSGQWLPEVEPFLDVDGDLNFGEIGDDSVTTVGDLPTPAAAADWGIRILLTSTGVNILYGATRDVSYNVSMPAAVAVNGLGEFSSATENFEFATGWFDYWIHPTVNAIRGRTQLVGGNNSSVLPSTFVVTPMGGGLTQYTLTIPIDIITFGDILSFDYDGLFVATTIIPEPAALSLTLVAIPAILFRVRKR